MGGCNFGIINYCSNFLSVFDPTKSPCICSTFGIITSENSAPATRSLRKGNILPSSTRRLSARSWLWTLSRTRLRSRAGTYRTCARTATPILIHLICGSPFSCTSLQCRAAGADHHVIKTLRVRSWPFLPPAAPRLTVPPAAPRSTPKLSTDCTTVTNKGQCRIAKGKRLGNLTRSRRHQREGKRRK